MGRRRFSLDPAVVLPAVAIHAIVFAGAWLATYNPAMVLFTGPVGGIVAGLRIDPRRSVLMLGVASGVLGGFPSRSCRCSPTPRTRPPPNRSW